MDAPAALTKPAQAAIEFKLDGQSLHSLAGESILKAAQRHGVEIPHLCCKDGLRSDGNCRACVVEIKGERTLAPSCCRNVTAGMEVQTRSERARKSQKMVLEMLLSDLPDIGYKWNDETGSVGQHGELSEWAARMDVSVRPELKALRREPPKADVSHPVWHDESHPAMAVNLDACIQCTRCVRACREVQVNDVIGVARRGAHSTIVFDLNDALGDSTCVACGECVQVCPTGALMPKTRIGSQIVDKVVDSVCPFWQNGQTESTTLSTICEPIRVLGISAPVGQTCTHSPQATHVLSPKASFKSNTIVLCAPRRATPITSFTCTSRQARTQRVH